MSDQDPVDRAQETLNQKAKFDRTHPQEVREAERVAGKAADNNDSAQRIKGNSGVEWAARFGELQGGAKTGVHRTFVLKDISFFESEFRAPLSSHPERSTSFLQSQTRFVNCITEITIPHEYTLHKAAVTARYLGDDGKVKSEETKSYAVEPGSREIRPRFEFGTNAAGSWLVGSYLVEILVNGETVGDKWFEIVRG